MGLSQVGTICQGLIQAGKPGKTPAAVISHATTAQQRTVVGTLATLADAVEKAELDLSGDDCCGRSGDPAGTVEFL